MAAPQGRCGSVAPKTLMRLTLPTRPDDELVRESRRRDAPAPVARGAGVLPEQVLREAESALDVHVLSEVLSAIRTARNRRSAFSS